MVPPRRRDAGKLASLTESRNSGGVTPFGVHPLNGYHWIIAQLYRILSPLHLYNVTRARSPTSSRREKKRKSEAEEREREGAHRTRGSFGSGR